MTDKTPKLSVLLYGKAGTGKTILASTFPNALVFDFDAGSKLYESHFPDNKYVRGGDMIKMLQGAIQQVKNGTFKYDTIVIDSLTNLENEAIAAAKGNTSENWVTNLYSSGGRKLGYTEWGNISGSTISILTELRKYDINVVIITQISTGSDNGRNYYQPNLVGKGADEALHFPDFVVYMTKTEEGRFAHLNSNESDNFVAKARLVQGDIAPIKNPNYDKMIKLVEKQTNKLNFK